MADQKVSDLPSLNGATVDPADLLYIVDSSAGTAGSKKITIGQFQLAPTSAATADAVAYYDGSKVLTSGSALTFDGTNLGVGTSSPGAKLDVSGNARASGSVTAGYSVSSDNIYIGPNGAAGNGTLLVSVNYANTTYQPLTQDASYYIWRPNGAEKMRLDSSGNLGVGTSSPGEKLVVWQGNIHALRTGGAKLRLADQNNEVSIESSPTGVASNMIFKTSATTQMTLDSSGNLLLGTTSNANNYKAFFQNTGSSAALGLFAMNATTPYGINIYYGAAAPNNSNAYTSFLYCNDTVGLKLQLNSNGGIQNFQANDTNLSDRREKTNFAPSKDYLDTICAIPVQTFNYIDQAEDDPGKTLGVVAQDVQSVAPELVHEANWGSEDEPKMRLSIYQTDLQYALMKALQELKAQNDELCARVAALEAK